MSRVYSQRQLSRAAHALAVEMIGPQGLHGATDDMHAQMRRLAAAVLDSVPQAATEGGERQVLGSLRSAIDAHGPITQENYGSAAKRIHSALRARIAELEDSR